MKFKSVIALRRKVDAIDYALLRLLARRQRVVRDIGREKRQRALPLRDAKRERALIADRVRFGLPLRLEVKFMRSVMRIILNASRRAQQNSKKQRV